MKRIIIPITVAFALFCVCGEAGAEDRPETVEGITPENYPRVDGSTSTEPLNTLIACKLLGWQYEWRPFLAGNGVWQLLPRGETMPEDFFGNRVKTSQTHNAFLNLIDGGADIVLSARKMSDEERAYAESADVEVIETPVALDALDFLVNSQNPVRSLTAAQVRDIYLRNLVNWREAGGADGDIRPFIRNPQSGSQEMMKEIVMNRAGMPDWEAGFDDDVLPTMALVYREVADNLHGICFTPHYYREYIIRDAVGADRTKTVAIEGVYPDARSIGDKTYPFVAPVYAVVRADADRLSMTGRLYDWLRTEAGKAVIAESGYVPTEATADVATVDLPAVRIYPNPVTDGFRVSGAALERESPARLTLTDLSGRVRLSVQVTGGEYVDARSLPKGVYIAVVAAGKYSVPVKMIKR